MLTRTLAEKIAIGLFGAALVVGGLLGVDTVKDLGQQPTTALVTSGSTTTDASGTDNSGGGSTTTTSGGGSTTTTGGGGGGDVTSGGNVTTSTGGASGATCNSSSPQIKVGGIFDETGAVDSTVERDTVRSYFRKYGCINGKQLTLLDCDSQYDTTRAVACANQMISYGVVATVGNTAPKGEDNIIKPLTDAGIPVIGGLGTPNEYKYSLSYPVTPSFEHYGYSIGVHACRDLPFRHPAIVDIGDVPWLAPVKAQLLAGLKTCGVQPTDIEDEMATTPDYTSAVFNLEHNNNQGTGCPTGTSYGPGGVCPDSLIAALDPFSYVRLFGAMHNAGWKPTLMALGLDKGSAQAQYASTGELDGAYSMVGFYSPYDHPTNPTVADYLATVDNYFPNQYAALDIYTQIAWTSAQVFVYAVRTLAAAGKDITSQNIIAEMGTIHGFGTGWSEALSYNTGSGPHDPNQCFTFMQYSGGWHTTSAFKCYPSL